MFQKKKKKIRLLSFGLIHCPSYVASIFNMVCLSFYILQRIGCKIKAAIHRGRKFPLCVNIRTCCESFHTLMPIVWVIDVVLRSLEKHYISVIKIKEQRCGG